VSTEAVAGKTETGAPRPAISADGAIAILFAPVAFVLALGLVLDKVSTPYGPAVGLVFVGLIVPLSILYPGLAALLALQTPRPALVAMTAAAIPAAACAVRLFTAQVAD